MTDPKTILVIGATGRQGGAVARALLASDRWHVRAFTRNPDQPQAQALAIRGAELVQGDMEDRASLDQALEGAWGVFSVQNFWTWGYEREVLQGRNVAEAAHAAHTPHVVYTSVGGADRHTGLPHFESKWLLEEYMRDLDLPLTVLRPVFFMDNFLAETYVTALLGGTLSLALAEGAALQMIAVRDIGVCAALAFEQSRDWLWKALEIAGDELTGPEMAARFAQVLGRPVEFVPLPLEELRAMSAEAAEMFEWFNAAGYQADIPSLRTLHPGLLDFSGWLQETGWSGKV